MKRQEKSTPPGKAEIPKAETLKLSGQGGEGRAGALPTGHLFLTKPQMAGILQVSVRTVTSMMASGELPFLRFQGRLIRFRLDDVQRQFTEKALVCKCLHTATDEHSDTSPSPLPGRGGEGADGKK